MKIGMLGPIAWRVPPRYYGGWELVVHHLTEGLMRRGHQVTLFASGDSLTTARLSSVVPQPLAEATELGRQARVWETLHMAAALARAGEFDLLHNNMGCYPVALRQLCPVPMVTTLHGSAAEADSRLVYGRFADGPYVSISEAERCLAPELRYAATVYNGIDTADFPFSRQAGQYLLVLGRMSPDKGIHLALDVAEQCGIDLVLAGIVPPENQNYFNTQIEPRLSSHARFIGPADHQLKTRLYAGALGFLHLVTYEEAFGLTMAEAMACGCPVIAFPRGSVPEVVADSETGFIVPDVAAAVSAVGDLRQIDRAACRRRVEEHFSLAQMIDGYEAVYRAAATA